MRTQKKNSLCAWESLKNSPTDLKWWKSQNFLQILQFRKSGIKLFLLIDASTQLIVVNLPQPFLQTGMWVALWLCLICCLPFYPESWEQSLKRRGRWGTTLCPCLLLGTPKGSHIPGIDSMVVAQRVHWGPSTLSSFGTQFWEVSVWQQASCIRQSGHSVIFLLQVKRNIELYLHWFSLYQLCLPTKQMHIEDALRSLLLIIKG